MKKMVNRHLYANSSDAKTLAVLFEISDALTHTRTLDELYQAIHESLKKIFKADNFYIALHHPDKDAISFPYHVDEKDRIPEEIFDFSRTASLTGRVIQSRKPMIFFEPEIIAYARQQNQKTIGNVSKVWLGAPLMVRKQVIGVISIQSYHSADDFQEKDLALLHTVSQHVALAIERKEFEEKLKKQQRLMESILENSPVGICQVKNRVFQWVNASMVHLFGYDSKAQFNQQSVRMIYASEADYEQAGDIIKYSLGCNGKVVFDFFLKRRDNSAFKAQIFLTKTDTNPDPLKSTIAIIADMSEKELIEKEKMERERLQGVLEMAGAICHEINQPLQTIMGYAELAEESENTAPKEMEQIRCQASRISDITRRLSRITRYKTMTYPGNKQIIDIWGASTGEEDKSPS
jgi:K+-sensing histidine kinase KdpD